ncbi:hypothetical protein FJW06_20815 [Mesorhizobium sp. B4-1-3]|nr:hypothetical protein FJW06_20815 [Mesorhizobium sp. B4-1-3]
MSTARMALLMRGKAEWLKPGLVGRVNYLKGDEKVCHVSLKHLRETLSTIRLDNLVRPTAIVTNGSAITALSARAGATGGKWLFPRMCGPSSPLVVLVLKAWTT